MSNRTILTGPFKLFIYRPGLAWPYSSITCSCYRNIYTSFYNRKSCTVYSRRHRLRMDLTDDNKTTTKNLGQPCTSPERRKSQKCCSTANTLFNNEGCVIVINKNITMHSRFIILHCNSKNNLNKSILQGITWQL
jgi:hypothetical protein